jgi:hypothetical protein
LRKPDDTAYATCRLIEEDRVARKRPERRRVITNMTDVTLVMTFLHFYVTGPAAKLAQGVRAAVDLLGKTSTARQ